ncbi:MAG: rhomboid family intramembrane serine protease [Lachnospiraceae bacterium]|mgnify:CR=1 FL=1
MNFMSKLERKFGRYAIPNLSIYLIGCMVIGYVISLVAPQAFLMLTLEPSMILRGQVWRLVTWILIPPSQLDIFTIIMLFFYYSIGTSLERTIGAFRYNVFLFGGFIITVVLSMAVYGVGLLTGTQFYFIVGPSVYYICLTIFLAFAALYPNMQVYLYFVIPVRVKWLAFLYVAMTVYEFVRSGIGAKVAIAASLINFLVFFLTSRSGQHLTPGQIKRRAAYQKKTKMAGAGSGASGAITRHKCAVCGRTEKDDENLSFRFCSQCNGNYEYCQDHLFTHVHVK